MEKPVKHRSLPLACAALTLSLGLTNLIAPPVLRAQTADATMGDAATDAAADATADDGTSSAGTVMGNADTSTGDTSSGDTSSGDTSSGDMSSDATTGAAGTDTTDSGATDSGATDSGAAEMPTPETESTTTTSTTTTSTTTSASGTTSGAMRAASNEATEMEVTEAAPANPDAVARATGFIAQALSIAEKNPAAVLPVVRQSASLIPRTGATWREGLTTRWLRLVQTADVPRNARLDAYSSFFDAATRVNRAYARRVALRVPDSAARAGAFLTLSQDDRMDWTRSVNYVGMAQRAARQERNPELRARGLTFAAYRLASLNPETREAAVAEASAQVRTLPSSRSRDYLLAETAGAAAKFDLALARRVASGIRDPRLKNLAQARINLAEISQSTITASSAERVSALARAAARYDVRAVPVLLQLPVQPAVLGALSKALPPIYPSARPAIGADLLERMWDYSLRAPAGVQRDELQSRLARLMVTQDVWRGRTWGKSLAWKGGRIQVGAFIKDVLATRRTQVRAMPLQDLAKRNVDAAVRQAQGLSPVARAEALLLIAGQLLETPTA